MPPTHSLPPLLRTKDLEAAFATFLIYGGARVGKTSLAQTAPNPIILATELGDTMGLQSLKNLDIPYIPIHSHDELVMVVRELQSGGKCTYEGETFETVIVDSLTQLGEMWMERGTEIIFGKNVDLWDKASRKDPRNVYAYVAEKGRQTMKLLFETRAHLVTICREGLMEEGKNEDAIKFAVPQLPGQKLGRELPGWPDFTFRMRFVNKQRVFVTQEEMRAVAGPRVPSDMHMPKYIQPHIGNVIKVMLGDKAALQALTLQKGSN